MGLAITCIGLLGLLVIALGLRVSMLRGSTSRAIGCNDDPADPLYKAIRAHGNACEYSPILAILILATAGEGYGWWMSLLFIATIGFRYAHAAGMLLSPTLEKGHPLRFAGALGTYVVGFLLSLAAIF
ncbi:MAG: MAPEG family protein [Candidatus Binatia bacterium]